MFFSIPATGKAREKKPKEEPKKEVPKEEAPSIPPPPPGPPPPPPRQAQLSAAQQERLRREYQSFGGSPDVASTNWALYIILFILFLVAASVLTGAL